MFVTLVIIFFQSALSIPAKDDAYILLGNFIIKLTTDCCQTLGTVHHSVSVFIVYTDVGVGCAHYTVYTRVTKARIVQHVARFIVRLLTAETWTDGNC